MKSEEHNQEIQLNEIMIEAENWAAILVPDETAQIEIRDFDEGDDKQTPESRIVNTRNNHQRMNFDVRSSQFKNFQTDIQKVI